jgi:Capsular polysaccharide synthesis protein
MKILWMYCDDRKTHLIRQIEFIPSFPPKYKTLIPTHQSDWIRLYLIMTYGGVWADASIIINSEKAMDELWEKTHDFVGFYNGGKQNGIYEIVESWCFASKKMVY